MPSVLSQRLCRAWLYAVLCVCVCVCVCCVCVYVCVLHLFSHSGSLVTVVVRPRRVLFPGWSAWFMRGISMRVTNDEPFERPVCVLVMSEIIRTHCDHSKRLPTAFGVGRNNGKIREPRPTKGETGTNIT